MKISELQKPKRLAESVVKEYDESEATKQYDAILTQLEQKVQQAVQDITALGVSPDRAEDIVWDYLQQINLPLQTGNR